MSEPVVMRDSCESIIDTWTCRGYIIDDLSSGPSCLSRCARRCFLFGRCNCLRSPHLLATAPAHGHAIDADLRADEAAGAATYSILIQWQDSTFGRNSPVLPGNFRDFGSFSEISSYNSENSPAPLHAIAVKCRKLRRERERVGVTERL